MVGGKAGVDDAQEGGGHVGLDRLVEGRVEPSYRPLSTSPPRRICSLLHSWWDVGELVFVACLVERLLVRGDGCLKDGLVGGDVGQAAVDSQGDVLDDRRRMVAVHVNMLDCFPWFVEGLVGLRGDRNNFERTAKYQRS